ncbi:putative lipoprotein [Neorhizobium galegae]|uniref:imelysin family protein n=1 Tax=Neorhizobium galegae TaxID=399 RepID=UPI001AE531AA|nr:imelysin family protein [Neorhizobium galegae]MBP2548313.1 putative lipoprotein [Neorhizobium galegae]
MSRWLSALALTLFLATPGLAEEVDATAPSKTLSEEATKQVMAKVVDDFIRPGYRAFAGESAMLTDAMAGLCAAPSQKSYEAAQSAFEHAARSWSRIEIVRVGPVLDAYRFERILFYPDRKGTGLRQVQAVLAGADDGATSPAGLAQKSVAVQGLGALEFVLYGTGKDVLLSEKDSFRCRYGLSIAGNVQRIATELTQLWDEPDGIQEDWKNPGADSAVFRDGHEGVTEALGILVHSAEAARDQRIETFYKGEANNTFPRQALFWRSKLTFSMLAGNLEGIHRLLDTSGFRDLLAPDQQPIVGSIDDLLISLTKLANEMEPDVEVAVADQAQRQKLDVLLKDSRDLILRLSDGLGGGLGLGAGFSFSDGD